MAIVSRCNKGSKNRDKAKQKLQRKWGHVVDQSNDFAQKLSSKLVNYGYTSFALEELNIGDGKEPQSCTSNICCFMAQVHANALIQG